MAQPLNLTGFVEHKEIVKQNFEELVLKSNISFNMKMLECT